MFSGLKKGIVTHSSLYNNDGQQETNTGHHTTHHTNSLIFQPILSGDDSSIILSEECLIDTENQNDIPQDAPLYYKIGKLEPPSLFTNYHDDTSRNILDESFAKDIIWALANGIPENLDEDPLPLLGSWTLFQKGVYNADVPKSLIRYLPANETTPEYGTCKEYLDFLLDAMNYLEVPHLLVHADEQVYARIFHLIWKHKESYHNIIPLLGGFHQLPVLQRIFYKRHAVIGYKDWFVDAGTIAHRSAAQAIESRQYYRSMRVHKEAFDALAPRRIEDIIK